MTIEDIERAVANLSQRELERFRAWFDEFDAVRFDARIERDATSGKLDRLADEALADQRAGRTREL
jgi:hypothetical protein